MIENVDKCLFFNYFNRNYSIVISLLFRHQCALTSILATVLIPLLALCLGYRSLLCKWLYSD